MKPFVALLVLILLAVIFLGAQSFQSRFFETTYTPAFTIPTPEEPAVGGGAPRKDTSQNNASSSGSSGFKGPTGQPRIIGPSAPPPGQ